MKNSAIASVIILCAISMACHEEEIESGFSTNSATGSEGDGAQSITIDLGKMTTTTTTITFQVGGDAGLDGDYTVEALSEYAVNSPFKIVVEEGQSTATINFTIIDDIQIEPRTEAIYFQITDVDDASILKTMTHTDFVYEITDNDSPPSSGMQVDLSWSLGDNVRINAANFDLYLASSLTLTSAGAVDTFNKIEGIESVNPTGFETYVLPDTLSNGQYYIMIYYASGTTDASLSVHLSQGSDYGSATGKVGSTYVGKYAYYGPLTKTGSTFSFN